MDQTSDTRDSHLGPSTQNIYDNAYQKESDAPIGSSEFGVSNSMNFTGAQK